MGVNGCNNGYMTGIHSLKITSEILSLISEIDEFKGAWQALSLLEPERLLALKKVATIESVGSSTRIEGSDLSDRDVEKLLSNLKIEFLKTRSEQEVANLLSLRKHLIMKKRNQNLIQWVGLRPSKEFSI